MKDQDKQARLIEIFRDARFVMLMTRDEHDDVVARPMSVARVDDDGTVYVSTSIDSEKVTEIEDDPRATITYQGKTAYAALSGTVRVSQDRALIHELWQADWTVWYPEGKDDPSIAILVFEPYEGHYWDQAGTKGLSFLYRAIKARITGEQPEPRPGDSEHVPLPG